MEKEGESARLFDFKGDWFFTTLIDKLAKRKPLEEYTGEEVKEITIKVLRGVTPDIAKLILGTLMRGCQINSKKDELRKQSLRNTFEGYGENL